MMWPRWGVGVLAAKVSEVIRRARTDGVQVITSNDTPVAVIVDYNRFVIMCRLLEQRTPDQGEPPLFYVMSADTGVSVLDSE